MTNPNTQSDTAPPTKLDQLATLLNTPEGATMDEMTAATAWQAHSVRGALAGALRKKGHHTKSAKVDGVRRWRIVTETSQ